MPIWREKNGVLIRYSPVRRARTTIWRVITPCLSPGHSPHPPHTHVEEEILIVLQGEADILIAEARIRMVLVWSVCAPVRLSTIPPTSTIRSGIARSYRSLI